MNKLLKGTGVAIVTPFHKHETIDFTALGRIIEHVIANGVNYIVALGTTGESATLTMDEKNAIVDYVVEEVNKRVPVVIGVGGYDTQEVVNRLKSMSFDGIDAILSVCPYYNKPQQRGIVLHYKTIAGACPVPLIMYNVPGRTSVNMTAETTLELASDVQNIIGIKEASGNFQQIMEVIRNKPKDFMVISGDDLLTLPLISIGADGVISVVANAFPGDFSEMVQLALKGNFRKAMEIHYKLTYIMNALFMDGSPSGIKAVLEIMGLCSNNLRLPVVKVNKPTYALLTQLIEKYENPN